MRVHICPVFVGFLTTAAIAGCDDTPNTSDSSSSSSASSSGSSGSSSSGQVGGMGGAGGNGGNAGNGGIGGAGGSGGIVEVCIPETCNGIDDDCNGQIDEGNPGGGKTCMTGLPGACSAGQTLCEGGSLICKADIAPGTQKEACNDVDDDCDAMIDEDIPEVGMACDTGLLGPCAAGKQTCAKAMLTCAPNVMSTNEVPDGIDNDCNGKVDDGITLGNGLWAKGYGNDTSNQYGFRIASDSLGNVAVTGRFSGTLDFGGGNLTMSGSPDIFLAKLDPNGGHIWSRVFLSAGTEGSANGLAFDSTGNLYTAGYIMSTTTINGTTLSTFGAGDIFITKHDPAGALLWSKVIGENTSAQNAYDVAATPTGGVAMTGTISAVVNFGGGGLNGSMSDAFLAVYDAAGTHLFSKRFGDATFQYGKGVAVNAAGEIVIAVDLQGTANFGGGVLTSAGNGDVAIAKFSAAGTHLWSKVFGSAAQQDVTSIAFDPSGNIVFTGATSGPVDFGCGAVSPPNTAGFYVQKLDSNGACVWTKAYGAVGNISYAPPRIAMDPAGNVLVAGMFVDVLDVGGGPMTAVQNSFDVFVLKLGPTGTHVWSKQYGDPVVFEYDECYGVASDPSGNVLLIGDYGATIDFGLGPMSSGDTNTQDVWVAKLSP